MNPKEILLVVDAVSNEKGISRQIIFEAIESALATASKKLHHSTDIDARVAIDQKTGNYETFRRWLVIPDEEELEFPDKQIHLSDAKKQNPDIEVEG